MSKTVNSSRDVSVVVQLGDIVVSWSAEGVSWNPSVARDMQDRTMSMLREVIQEAQVNGILVAQSEVFFDDGSNEGEEEGEDGE